MIPGSAFFKAASEKIAGDIVINERKHSYSGVDISAVLIFPDISHQNLLNTDNSFIGPKSNYEKPSLPGSLFLSSKWKTNKNYKILAELQTISISSAVSLWPVRTLGQRAPNTFTRGARTFAGSLVFAVLDKDVLYEAFRLYGIRPSHDKYFIDQLPEFDVIISATNEYGDSAIQIISGITISNSGTTYSIDDLYTEATYTYVAKHATPFIKLVGAESDLIGSPYRGLKAPRVNQPFDRRSLIDMIPENRRNDSIRGNDRVFRIGDVVRGLSIRSI